MVHGKRCAHYIYIFSYWISLREASNGLCWEGGTNFLISSPGYSRPKNSPYVSMWFIEIFRSLKDYSIPFYHLLQNHKLHPLTNICKYTSYKQQQQQKCSNNNNISAAVVGILVAWLIVFSQWLTGRHGVNITPLSSQGVNITRVIPALGSYRMLIIFFPMNPIFVC